MAAVEKRIRASVSSIPAVSEPLGHDLELADVHRQRSRETWTLGSPSQQIPSDVDEVVRLTPSQKWITIFTACTVSFAVSIDSTAILSVSTAVCTNFQIDQTNFQYSIFLLTVWTGAAAILPLFVYPIMEEHGTRQLYLTAFAVFVLSVATEAVTPTFAGLIVARMFAGAAGGIVQNAVDGMAADFWEGNVHLRAFSLSIYVTALLSGIIFGSVFGGLIARSLSWRWIFYIELIIYGPLVVYTYFTLKEPRAYTGTPKPHQPLGSKWTMLSGLWASLRLVLGRGIQMLFSEFIVSTFTLWTSFAFGTVFMMAASIPQVCAGIYGWSEAWGGIFSTPLLIGALLGGLACCIQDLQIYPRLTAERPNPEARLYLAIPATLIGIVAGIFIYAWAATPSTHWIVLAIALTLAGFGIVCVVTAVAIYITDCYAQNAASAISAVALGENAFAAFLPLATRKMYTSLGFAWAGTFLGIIALCLCLAPILLIMFGPRIRARSQYLSGKGSR